jgi:integrase
MSSWSYTDEETGKTLWRARFWYYKNKVKRSKQQDGFARKKDADKWCIDEKRKLEGLQDGADKQKVGDFLDRWIKTREKKLSPATVAGYKVNIEHIKRHIGNVELYKLNLMDVQEMLDALREEKKKYRTVRYVHRTLHAALNYAVKTKAVETNVSTGAEIAEDDEAFHAVVYNAELLGNLLVALQDFPLYPAVLLASMRGLRRGECLGLRWSDIDFETKTARIQNNYVRVNGEDHHGKVKTEESNRTISIKGFVGDELKRIKDENTKKGIIKTYVCEHDGKLPDPTHISRAIKNFQKANGFPLCRFHDLRHTFARLQIKSGTDLDTLKRLLGHNKIATTSDMYLDSDIEMIEAASVKLDNVVFMKMEDKEEKTQK